MLCEVTVTGTDVVHRTYHKEKQLVRNNWRQELWRIDRHLPNSPNFYHQSFTIQYEPYCIFLVQKSGAYKRRNGITRTE